MVLMDQSSRPQDFKTSNFIVLKIVLKKTLYLQPGTWNYNDL